MYGIDPAKHIEYVERRTKGCFACQFSQYGIPDESKLKTKRSYCQQIEAGLLKADYPNMSESDPCFLRRKV